MIYQETKATEAFLADLKVVYEKHGMVVNPCACNGGTYIDAADQEIIDYEIKKLREER